MKHTVIDRMKKPTPRFFQKIRNTAIALAAIGGAILATPVALPTIVIKLAGYLVVAGSVAGCVSQTAVKNDRH